MATHFSSQNQNTEGSLYNTVYYIVKQILKKTLAMPLPVRVKAVWPIAPGKENTNSGESEEDKTGLVDVELLVDQLNNRGELVETRIIYGVPYNRIQGGRVALVVDPEIDDIGWLVPCSKDISTFKRSKDKSIPESYRIFSQSDAMYIGGSLNKEPEIYIRMHTDDGIIVESAETNLKVHIGGNAEIVIDGNSETTIKGNSKVTIEKDSEVTIKGDSKITVEGNSEIVVEGNTELTVQGNVNETVQGNMAVKVSGTYNVDATHIGFNDGGGDSAGVHRMDDTTTGHSCE